MNMCTHNMQSLYDTTVLYIVPQWPPTCHYTVAVDHSSRVPSVVLPPYSPAIDKYVIKSFKKEKFAFTLYSTFQWQKMYPENIFSHANIQQAHLADSQGCSLTIYLEYEIHTHIYWMQSGISSKMWSMQIILQRQGPNCTITKLAK